MVELNGDEAVLASVGIVKATDDQAFVIDHECASVGNTSGVVDGCEAALPEEESVECAIVGGIDPSNIVPLVAPAQAGLMAGEIERGETFRGTPDEAMDVPSSIGVVTEYLGNRRLAAHLAHGERPGIGAQGAGEQQDGVGAVDVVTDKPVLVPINVPAAPGDVTRVIDAVRDGGQRGDDAGGSWIE